MPAAVEGVSEAGRRYIDFLIPGLVGLNLMGSGMWGVGFSIVVARTRKLLKRLAATPMRRSDFLLSFILSRLVFLVPEVAALVGFGWLVFGVVVRGASSTSRWPGWRAPPVSPALVWRSRRGPAPARRCRGG